MDDQASLPVEPAILVIFGITGDLSRKKLLPALYHLAKANLLPESFAVLGVTRQQIEVESVLDQTTLCSRKENDGCDTKAFEKLRSAISILHMDLNAEGDYETLRQTLEDIDASHGVCMNRLYYLAVPPQAAEGIISRLGSHGLNKGCSHGKAASRMLIEKPFGFDLPSAEQLVSTMNQTFDESQIFRIDHYVARETVQNILTFRFNNPLFGDVWSADYIKQIEIQALERIDIEGRATFYEATGALRDFIQSHLMQLLAIVTMDRPLSFTSEGIHQARLHLLESVRAPRPKEVSLMSVRGQYDTYKTEVNNPDSFVETYAALKLFIESERWDGVPMILRSGKGLKGDNNKTTQIIVTFKDRHGSPHENKLVFRIQPDEGISIQLNVKKPGFEYSVQEAVMDFSYSRTFDSHTHPDAYERVIIDAMKGDRTLFATSQEVLAAWRAVDPVMQAWTATGDGLRMYSKGSEPPEL